MTASLPPASAQRALTIGGFFDGSRLYDLRPEMAPADWRKLKDNRLDRTCYPCRVDWNGIVVKNVVVKSRGSGSRNPIKPRLGLWLREAHARQRTKPGRCDGCSGPPSFLHPSPTKEPAAVMAAAAPVIPPPVAHKKNRPL